MIMKNILKSYVETHNYELIYELIFMNSLLRSEMMAEFLDTAWLSPKCQND